MENRIIRGILLLLFCAMPAASVRAGESGLVSLNVCTDQLLAELFQPSRIQAVIDRPHDAFTREVLDANPGIRKLRASAEEVLMLAPEHVFLSRFQSLKMEGHLRSNGVPVTRLEIPQSLREVALAARQMIAAAGGDRSASEKVDAFEAAIKSASAGDGGGLRVLIWGPGGHVAGRGTYEDDILKAAGFINLAAETGITGHAWLSVEELIRMHPDWILTAHPPRRDFHGYDKLYHPAIKKALPETRWVELSPETWQCASLNSLETVRYLRELASEPR